MSNYRSRKRARKAENEVRRVRDECSRMLREAEDRQRRELREHYAQMHERFHLEHLAMTRQMEHLTGLIVKSEACRPRTYLVPKPD